MSVLSAAGLTKSFGAHDVWRDVGLALAQGQRAGLVGRNGAGKTTLLEVLAGRQEPDAGQLGLARGVRVGYLPQDPDLPEGTLRAAALTAHPELGPLQRRLRALEADLAAGAAVLGAYGEAQQAFEAAGGYDWEHRVDQVLGGLGFAPSDSDRDLATFSGGQRLRAALARLLLAEPDLLLLDEPTNHLDAAAVSWLESWLPRWVGAAVIVSHDRYFLDRVCTDMLELQDGALTAYRGNYTAYARQRAERLAAQKEAAERADAERARLTAYIERYRAGNRSRQAKSRAKRLERLEQERAGLRVPRGDPSLRLRFAAQGQSGREVLAMEGVAKAFGPRVLFHPFEALVLRGERIGLVGANGTGKTTLLRILAGQEGADAGEVWWGSGVSVGLFRQDLGGLDDEGTVLDAVLEAGPDLGVGAARDLLARFLFRGDAVFTRVGDLSGGERNRLSLCRLMLAGDNVLLLDEPTNHLDIASREALEAALSAFAGTLLVASHDRYLLARVATRIWSLEDGRIEDFEGGFEAFVAARQTAAPQTPVVRPARPAPRTTRPAPAARAVPDTGELERRIEALEAERADLETRLADAEVYRSGGGAAAVGRYREVQAELDDLYRRWEEGVGSAGTNGRAEGGGGAGH